MSENKKSLKSLKGQMTSWLNADVSVCDITTMLWGEIIDS